MKTIVILGASGDIGKVVLKAFYNKGFNVVAGYHNNKKALDDFIKTLKPRNNQILTKQINLESEQSIVSFFDDVKKFSKEIYGLVNCAGVSRPSLLIDAKSEDIAKEINTNLVGAIMATKHALPLLNQKNSRLINISSVWGVVGGSCESTYSASKGGLISFTKAIAKEMGPSGLTSNCICPGLIKTKMNAHLTKEDYAQIKNETPLARFATTSDIANLCLFLASDKAKNITGQVITLDAGWTL